MGPIVETRARKRKQNQGLRARAPVAAQFEDCYQAVQQLVDALSVNRSQSEAYYNIARDCRLKLIIWAKETGASSRLLDYALSRSLTTRKHTLRLLKDLHVALDQAISKIQPRGFEGDITEETPPSMQSAESMNSETPVVENTTHPEDIEDIELSPKTWLEESQDILVCLNQLLPTLRDPTDEDGQDYKAFRTDAAPTIIYRRLAKALFPKASPALILRLCEDNWRRSKMLENISRKGLVSDRNFLVQSPPGFPINRQSARQETEGMDRRQNMLHHLARTDSDGEQSTVRSNFITVVSRTAVLQDNDSATSMTDELQNETLQDLTPPDPPVDLDKKQSFDCPYCHFELPLTVGATQMTLETWFTHVYLDLKPYVCTFGQCHRQHTLFASRQAWFQHELDFHRSRMVWQCGFCRIGCDSQIKFLAHLRSAHSHLKPEALMSIAQACQHYAQEPIQSTKCDLCGSQLANVSQVEDHIGRHLESFAAAVLHATHEIQEDPAEDHDRVQEFIDNLQSYQAPDNSISRRNQIFGPQPLHEVSADQELGAEVGPGGPEPDSDSDVEDVEELEEQDDDSLADESWIEQQDFDQSKQIRDEATERVQQYQDSLKRYTTTDRSNVPQRYNNFVGRDEDLKAIHQQLSIPGRICTVSGRGGIGKTALVIEYLYAFDNAYSHVFWVEADNQALFAETYGMIGKSLGIDKKRYADEEARLFNIRASLSNSDVRWLLILDNVTAWSDVARYLPRNLHRTTGSVLMTTRTGPITIPRWFPYYKHHHTVVLDVWPREHGQEFLLTSIQPKLLKKDLPDHEDYAVAAKVVEAVGCLPLAISMIVGYVESSRCTLETFMEMWEEKEHIGKKKLTNRISRKKQADVDSTIDSLWTIGIRDVRVGCRRLLDILSFFDAETIQKELLVGHHTEKYLEFLDESEAISYKRMINELVGRRLIQEKKTRKGGLAYNIHRLLQDKVLVDMEGYAFADAFRKAFRLIRKRFPSANPQQVPTTSSWEDCQEYMPHVHRFHKIYYRSAQTVTIMDPKPIELGELFYDAAFYIWARGTTSYNSLKMLSTAENTLKTDREVSESHSKAHADILCITGLISLGKGCLEREEGLKRLKQAWDIRKIIYAGQPNHDNDVLLQNAANDYALSLLNKRQFGEAGAIMRDCRRRYLEWSPDEEENPFENSKFYNNYSIVLIWEGKMDEAVAYATRSVELTQMFSEKTDIEYRRKFVHANTLLQAGNVQGALEKHLEVLDARIDLHTRHHELTISSMYAVGAMYHLLGDRNSAIEYIKECIECAKSARWPSEAFARAQFHLAKLYKEAGRKKEELDEAEIFEAESRKVLEANKIYAAECVRDAEDELMIFDDLQPTFTGRYTSATLLPYLRKNMILSQRR